MLSSRLSWFDAPGSHHREITDACPAVRVTRHCFISQRSETPSQMLEAQSLSWRGRAVHQGWCGASRSAGSCSAHESERPAALEDIVVVYGTGEGQTTPGGVTGGLATEPYPQPVSPVNVLIGGRPAEILYAGAAPGYAGLMQINVRIPLDAKTDGGSVELMLKVGERSSQNGVTVEVR